MFISMMFRAICLSCQVVNTLFKTLRPLKLIHVSAATNADSEGSLKSCL